MSNSKKDIVIASVLKPVYDPRMYDKLAMTLAQDEAITVHVIGHYQSGRKQHPHIKTYPIFRFRRLSFKRLFVQIKLFFNLCKIQPKIICVNTHELLISTIFYKLLFRIKIIYDIRENYYYNIKYTDAFPKLIRHALAKYVRIKERLCLPLFDEVIIAEQVYADQMPYLKKPYLLENKSVITTGKNIHPVRLKNKHPLRFIYSGTIAKSYGIFDVIALVRSMHEADPSIELDIIGYAPDTRIIKELHDAISDKPYIRARVGDTFIPHEDILEKIQKSDVAIMGYTDNKSLEGKVPTKVFEYMATGLPMVLPSHFSLPKQLLEYKAFIYTDFQLFNAINLVNSIRNTTFYTHPDKKAYDWSVYHSKVADIFK